MVIIGEMRVEGETCTDRICFSYVAPVKNIQITVRCNVIRISRFQSILNSVLLYEIIRETKVFGSFC